MAGPPIKKPNLILLEESSGLSPRVGYMSELKEFSSKDNEAGPVTSSQGDLSSPWRDLEVIATVYA